MTFVIPFPSNYSRTTSLFSYCWFNLSCCGYQFYDFIWKKVGKSVEVGVIRESSAAHLNLKVFVDETSPEKVNK